MDDALTVTRTASTPRIRGGRGNASASMWPAVAAWGAALIQLALGAGAVTAPDGLQAVGLPLIALGAYFLAWGAMTLARGRIVAPRLGITGVLAGLVLGALALWTDPVRTSIAAVAAASVLLLAVAFGCGRAIRASRGAMDAAPPRLAGLFVAAVIVAAVVTPALGATEAGRMANDHTGHELVIDGGHTH